MAQDRCVGERAAQQDERVQSSWNHTPVFAAANGHIAKIFSVIQQVEKRRCGECSAEKLPCAEVSSVSANRINVASEVNVPPSTCNAPRNRPQAVLRPQPFPGRQW